MYDISRNQCNKKHLFFSFFFFSVRESTIIVHFGDFFFSLCYCKKDCNVAGTVSHTYLMRVILNSRPSHHHRNGWSIVLSYCSNFLGWLYMCYQGLTIKLWTLTSPKDKIKSKLGNCHLIVNTNTQVLFLRLHVMIHRNDRLSKQNHSDSEP